MTDTMTFPHYCDPLWASDLQPDGSVWLTTSQLEWIPSAQSHMSVPVSINAAQVIVDVEVLQAALDQITNNPETWNQTKWFTELPEEFAARAAAPECGTAGCLAGTIVLQQGARLGPIKEPLSGNREVLLDGVGGSIAMEVATSLLLRHVAGRGQVLHLTDALWAATNSLRHLWNLGQLFASGRLTVPSDKDIARAQEISRHLYDLIRVGPEHPRERCSGPL